MSKSLSSGHSSINTKVKRTLPIEIWGIIFCQACTDDGTTGRSLSLVSKDIRDASIPYKYQCLLVEEHQIRPLISTLKKLSDDERRVKHLFMVSRNYNLMIGNYADSRFFQTDKNQLLLLLSSALLTLEVLSFTGRFPLPFEMPALVELFMHVHNNLDIRLKKRSYICYPNVRRFTLIDTSGLTIREPQYAAMGREMPKLEKLFLSVDGFAAITSASRLTIKQLLLKDPPPFPLIEKIIFHPCQRGSFWRKSDPKPKFADFDRRFVMLKSALGSAARPYSNRDVAEQGWRRRISGTGEDRWSPAEEKIDHIS